MIARASLALLLSACATASTERPPASTPPAPAPAAAVPATAATPAAEAPADPPAAEAPAGPFSRERIREIVRANYAEVGECYAAGLARDPGLRGTIEMHLAIGEDGTVVGANAAKGRAPAGRKDDDRITDEAVVSCVERVFTRLRFPATGRGLVNMIYPVVLAVE